MGFSRQRYLLPFPPPGDLPDPGIEPTSPVSPALAGEFFTTSATWEPLADCMLNKLIQLVAERERGTGGKLALVS